MDAIGFIASLLTLVSTAVEGAKTINTLYKAPKDLDNLVFELEHFKSVLEAIQDLHQPNIPPLVDTILKRSRETIEDLQLLIDTKLRDDGPGISSNFKRRVAWARYKPKIQKSKSSLKEDRHELIAVLSAVSSSFSFRVDARLTSFNRNISHIRTTTNTIRDIMPEHASITQRTVQENTRAIEEYNQITQQVLNELRSNISYRNRLDQLSTRFEESLHLLSSRQGGAIMHSIEDEPTETNNSHGNRSPINDFLQQLNNSIAQEPASSFERSPTFYPEQYAQNIRPSLVSRLNLIWMSEYSISNSERVDIYHVRFARSPRIWQFYNISLSIGMGSKYYGVTRIAKRHSLASLPIKVFPALFEKQVENLLLENESSQMHTDISLEVVDTKRGLRIEERAAISKQEDEALMIKSRAFLDFIRDIGCPQFCEGDIVQLDRVSNGHGHICSLPGGKICYEKLVDLDDFCLWDRIKTWNLFRDKLYIRQFFGVVTDNPKTYIRGILIQPFTGEIIRCFTKAQDLDTRIPWNQCEQWAWQLTYAVSEVHSSGNVVGGLGDFTWSYVGLDQHYKISIDFSDGRAWENQKGITPPECRPPNTMTTRSDMNTRADLFQLGMFLWSLAMPEAALLWGNPFCHIVNCPNAMGQCIEPHSNPIALPALGNNVPSYYQEIVDICRAEQPSDRLPASELLSKFPPITITTTSALLDRIMPSAYVPNIVDRSMTIWCDTCGQTLSLDHYHCNICADGDFDICKTCVEKGTHCYDYEHFLEERLLWPNGGIFQKKKFHSKKTATGEMRDTVFQF